MSPKHVNSHKIYIIIVFVAPFVIHAIFQKYHVSWSESSFSHSAERFNLKAKKNIRKRTCRFVVWWKRHGHSKGRHRICGNSEQINKKILLFKIYNFKNRFQLYSRKKNQHTRKPYAGLICVVFSAIHCRVTKTVWHIFTLLFILVFIPLENVLFALALAYFGWRSFSTFYVFSLFCLKFTFHDILFIYFS